MAAKIWAILVVKADDLAYRCGDPSFTDHNAVGKRSFTYMGALLVTQSTAEQFVSATFMNTTTYNLGRDSVSTKATIPSIAGNCPTCGLPPNVNFEYSSLALLPSAMVDGRGIRVHLRRQ